ncbi:MAG: hypothetical protein M3Z09_08625 [Acidobacteriota bacterium]|nr:hypothetical protein [Acidobacteriota bacterium]
MRFWFVFAAVMGPRFFGPLCDYYVEIEQPVPLLEAKLHLLRMRQEIPLPDAEAAAVDEVSARWNGSVLA